MHPLLSLLKKNYRIIFDCLLALSTINKATSISSILFSNIKIIHNRHLLLCMCSNFGVVGGLTNN